MNADPTGLGDLRDGLTREVTRRWTDLARGVKRAVLADAVAPQIAPTADRAHLFRRWLDERLISQVAGYDGSWLEPPIDAASSRGVLGVALGDAQQNLGFLVARRAPSAKVCHAASVNALAGVCEDTSQRAHDAVAHGLLSRARPAQIARLLDQVFGRGLARTKALAEHAISMSFNQGTLDALEASGVEFVGTVSEGKRLTDGDPSAAHGLPCHASPSHALPSPAAPRHAEPRRAKPCPAAGDDDTSTLMADFDPDEPRDPAGKWTTSAGGPGGAYLIPTILWKGKRYYPPGSDTTSVQGQQVWSHGGAARAMPPDVLEQLSSEEWSDKDVIRYETSKGELLNRYDARAYAESHGILMKSAFKQRDLISEHLESEASDPAHLRFQGVLGEGGMTAVSPSTHDIDFAGAVAGLAGEKQRKFALASAEIDQGLGLEATDVGVVGAWKDGAENSLATTVQHADWDRLTTSAAMKAHLSNQKAALAFQQSPDGGAALYKMHAAGDLGSIHAGLLEDGVAFHSLAPDADGKGATVYVVDLDGSAFKPMAKAAERFNGKVDYQLGRAAFLGSDGSETGDGEQRAAARAAYEGVIGQSKVPGAADLWARVRSHWGQAFLDALRALFDAARLTPQPQHPKSGQFAKAHVVARERRRSKRSGQFRRQGLSFEEQRKAELTEARFARVPGKLDVLTQNDDRVCQVCQDISDNGPYTIGRARSLLPAHLNCRCLFVAAGSMALDGVFDFNPDEPRDETGKWTSGPHTPREWLGHINEADRARFAALAASGQPLVFYHGTASDVAKKILKRGIVPHGSAGADLWAKWHSYSTTGSVQEMQVGESLGGADTARLNKERLGSVYISDDQETAERFASLATEVHPGSGATVFKVTIPAEQVGNIVHDELSLSMPAYRFHGKIDPKWISVAEQSYAGEPFPTVGRIGFGHDAEPPLVLFLTVLSDEAGVAEVSERINAIPY